MLTTAFILACISIVGNLQFPSSSIHPQMGYGDYNFYCEFHTGTDFPIAQGEFALVPHAGVNNYLVHWFYGAGTNDCGVMLSTDPEKLNGWTLEHLDYSYKEDELWQDPPHIYTDTVATCCYNSMGRHVHLAWLTDAAFSAPFAQEGLVNPLDSLPIPAGFDEAMFGYLSVLGGTSGAKFLLDSTQQIFDPGLAVYGVVDAVISPFSAANGDPSSDKCGVRSLSYTMAFEDPYYNGNVVSELYNDFLSYGERILFDMTYYLPDDGDNIINMPQFLAVYWLAYQGPTFKHDVVVTNSGILGSVGNECLENVWTDSYDRAADWADFEHHRGGWDTRLGINPAYPVANHHSSAQIFDGRYAVRATAVSQGSMDSITRYLPAVDVMSPESVENMEGIVVDNYKPYVEAIKVYQFPDFRILYDSEWEMNVTNCPDSGMSLTGGGSFYLPIGQNNIGVAVKYSEVVTPNHNDIRMQTESGGSTVWQSYLSFNPVSWRSELGSAPNYTADNGAFWQCYESRGFAFPGYKGRVQLLVNTQTGARDLASNTLDANPATVVPPRDEYTGVWDLIRFDADPFDSSYTWGTAGNFRRVSTSLVSGTVLGDYRVDVGLDTCLYSGQIISDCPYVCGFWMERFYCENDADPDTAYVVAVDGATEDTSWFEIPIDPTSIVCTLAPNSNSDPIHSAIGNYDAMGRYIWLSVNEMDYNYTGGVQIGNSTGSVVCVDAIGGIVLNLELEGIGSDWYPAPFGVFNGDHIFDLECYSPTSAMVHYWDATGIGAGFEDSVLVEIDLGEKDLAVCSSNENSNDDQETSSLSAIECVNLLQNPVQNSISLCTSSLLGNRLDLEVYDLSGRVVLNRSFLVTSSKTEIEMSAFPAGVYIVQVRTGENTRQMRVVLTR